MIEQPRTADVGVGRPQDMTACCAWLLRRIEALENDLVRRGFRRDTFTDDQSGLVPAAAGVGSGSYLDGSGAWSVPPAPIWGAITGTITNQTDLVAAFVQKGAIASSGLTMSGAHLLGATGSGAVSEIALGAYLSIASNTLQVTLPEPTWGDIVGTITDQPDLVLALGDKADAAAVASALSGKADIADVSHYRWIGMHATAGTNVSATSVPSAPRFMANSWGNGKLADLQGCTEVRLSALVMTAAASGASPRLLAKYATSWSTSYGSWSNLGASAAEVPMSLSSTGIATSGWLTMDAAAAIETCYLAIGEGGGDGSTSYTVRSVWLEFR